MKKSLFLLLPAAALVASVAVGQAAAAKPKPKPVPKPVTVTFVGSYSGKGAVNGQGAAAQVTANLSGTATAIGKSTMVGKGTANTDAKPCPVFGGTAVIAAGKDTILVSVDQGSKGCAASEDDTNNVSLSGTATVTGGTGKFAKAKGTLRFSGQFDRAAGNVSTTWGGKLTY